MGADNTFEETNFNPKNMEYVMILVKASDELPKKDKWHCATYLGYPVTMKVNNYDKICLSYSPDIKFTKGEDIDLDSLFWHKRVNPADMKTKEIYTLEERLTSGFPPCYAYFIMNGKETIRGMIGSLEMVKIIAKEKGWEVDMKLMPSNCPYADRCSFLKQSQQPKDLE